MAIVSLKRDWFDTEGRLWSARLNPHEMDEGLLDALPTDAVVDGVAKNSDAKVSKAETLESQKQALAEKEREEKVVKDAGAKANDVKHAAVVHKTATPPKL